MTKYADRQPTDPQKQWRLATPTRWVAAIIGAVLVLLAAVAVVWQFPTAFEKDGRGMITKSSRNVSDLGTVTVPALLGGVALLVFALNGVRLLRVKVGSLAAEGSSAAAEATNYYEKPPTDTVQEVEIEEESPEPTESPTEEVVADNTQMAVFELRDVPVRVILDTLGQWPADAGKKPETLGDFQFATRKRGKGNHPWTLKFRNSTPVKVSYGGREKTEGTVKPS